MTDTPNLAMPFIDGGQAQKHVTHNEALRILDAAVQLAVLDITRTTPPVSPVDGQRHAVAAGATGAWAGKASSIAIWQDGGWAFVAPKPGWHLWSIADNGLMVFTGTAWQLAGGLSLRADAVQALSAAQQAQARANAGVAGANLLINGDFRINQRGYVSAATLAAGAYGHDRWKAGASGGNYSFTQLKSSTQVTIAAGKTLIQVIEDADVAGGSYVLSWTGTCLARVGVNSATPSGAYAASPIAITSQSAGTVMSVEFGNGASAGTLGTAKLEAGLLATPFAMTSYQDELAKARRFFQRFGGEALADVLLQGVAAATGDAISTTLMLTPPMRAVPVVTRTGTFTNANIGSVNFYGSRSSIGWQLLATGAGFVHCFGNIGSIDCSAEL